MHTSNSTGIMNIFENFLIVGISNGNGADPAIHAVASPRNV
jgi:hypothetical protein